MITSLAINRVNDQPVHISEVDRGLKCGCYCADCEGTLVARKGEIKKHYFAHYNFDITCSGETNLHRYAKQVLVDELRINIYHPDLGSSVEQTFDSAQPEVTRESVRLDCLMVIGNAVNSWYGTIQMAPTNRHSNELKKKWGTEFPVNEQGSLNIGALRDLITTICLIEPHKVECKKDTN